MGVIKIAQMIPNRAKRLIYFVLKDWISLFQIYTMLEQGDLILIALRFVHVIIYACNL